MSVVWLGTLGVIWLAAVAILRRRGSPFHKDLLAGGILALLTLGFFWRVVTGEVYQPADGGDLVSFLFPTYRFAASQLRQWTLPLWNPHLYGGAPFIGDIQAGFLYLPNLLLFLLKPDFPYQAMQWLVMGHIFWAGLGTYVLVHSLTWQGRRLSRLAALFAALAFQFSDPLLIHLGNLNLIAVLSWMPWVLAAYHRGLTRGSVRWAVLAGVLFALGNYAGHAQSTFYLGLAVGLYTLFWLLAGCLGPGSPRSLLRASLLFATVAGVTLLLTAPILLPALEITPFTERSQLTYQETTPFSLAPTQAIGLITPGFFGRGPALHWGLWDRVELPYAGVPTLILALAALLVPGADRRRWRALLPWLGMALFGFLTALGLYAIVHGWLTLLLPGFDRFRAPARALVLWSLGISVLAAHGLDSLAWPQRFPGLQEDRRALAFLLRSGGLLLAGILTPLLYLALLLTQENPTLFVRASVAALAVTIAAGLWLITWALVEGRLRGWLGGGTFACLLLALLFLDLSATGAYTDISPRNPASTFQHLEIVQFLRSDPELFRMDSRTGIDDLWQPDTAALYGLFDVWGVANPLVLRHWTTLWEATGGRQTRLYDMLNVKYVLVRDGTPLPEGKFTLALDAPGELAVYRNATPLPRAWLVHRAIPVADQAAAFQALAQPDFDPAQAVILEGDVPSAAGESGGSSPAPRFLHYGANRMRLQLQADGPGYLVLSEVWYPGWRAWVNGEEARVLRANGALRAVAVPGGESTVELRFAPTSWRNGQILGALGVLVALLLGMRGWRFR